MAGEENGVSGRGSGVYDLAKFAIPPVVFRTRQGREYRIDGDPQSGVMVLMLRLEGEIKGIELGGPQRPLNQAIADACELVRRMIRDYDPAQDLEEFDLGVGEILTLFSLISGGDSVADAVQEGIVTEMRALQGDPSGEGEGVGDGGPLGSEMPSPGRSLPASAAMSGSPAGGSG